MRIKILIFITLLTLKLQLAAQPPSSEDITQAREFFNMGVKDGIDEKFEDAIAWFEKAIELNPLFAEAFLYKGLAEIETENYDQAVKDLTITIELDPEFSDQAHYFRGLARYFKGEYELSVDDFTIAIRMSPDFVSFYQRGKANLELKEYRRALQDFDIALRLKEDFYEANLYRGICLYYMERYEASLTDLNIADEKLPANEDVEQYLTMVATAMRNGDSASSARPVRAATVSRPVNETTQSFNQQAQPENNSISSNHSGQSSGLQLTDTLSPANQSITQENQLPDVVLASNQNSPVVAPTEQPENPTRSTDIDFSDLFRKSSENQTVNQEPENATARQTTVVSNGTVVPQVPAANIAGLDLENMETGLYGIDLQSAPNRGFGVQVASYSNTSNLKQLAEAYNGKYNQPVFINIANVNGRKLYKLIIGKFDNRTLAEQFRDQLRADNFPDSFLVVFENL